MYNIKPSFAVVGMALKKAHRFSVLALGIAEWLSERSGHLVI
jgi:hypothetical protein